VKVSLHNGTDLATHIKHTSIGGYKQPHISLKWMLKTPSHIQKIWITCFMF